VDGEFVAPARTSTPGFAGVQRDSKESAVAGWGASSSSLSIPLSCRCTACMPLTGSGSLVFRKILSFPMFLIVAFGPITQSSNSMYKEAVAPTASAVRVLVSWVGLVDVIRHAVRHPGRRSREIR
jgi:hypothetical protein